MATSWYKRSTIPRLLRRFILEGNEVSLPRKTIGGEKKKCPHAVEVWHTTCIVTNFGKLSPSGCSTLINPSNPGLTGVNKFPYFPRGGPEPKEQPQKHAHHIMGYVSQWGGMEVGDGMLFSANVIDGLVHQLGGLKLAFHIQMLSSRNEKCPVGHAVTTPAGASELLEHYTDLVHTTPPFYQHHPDPHHYLSKCYQNAFQLAFSQQQKQHNAWSTPNSRSKEEVLPWKVACPLIGAGCRGFPLDIAIKIAAEESLKWLENLDNDDFSDVPKTIAFGIPEISTAETLTNEIDDKQQQQTTIVE